MELYGTSAWSLHTRFGSFRYYEASLNDAAAAASSVYMARLYASPDRGPVRLLYTAFRANQHTKQHSLLNQFKISQIQLNLIRTFLDYHTTTISTSMVRHTILFTACLLGSAAASFALSDKNLDRRETQVSDNGKLFCGIFGSGSKDNIENLEIDLSVGKLADKMYTIGAGQCNRVHCDDTTGIYVCNVSILPWPSSFSPAYFPSLLPISHVAKEEGKGGSKRED